MDTVTCDLAIVGAGPGGYVAAIYAAKHGLDVVLIDEKASAGGTCLHVGCIPSKSLLHAAHIFDSAQHGERLGIKGDISLDFTQFMKNKDSIVSQLTSGVQSLIKKNKIQYIHGKGAFIDAKSIQVQSTIVHFSAAIIATGSSVSYPPFAKIDEQRIVSSTGALSLSKQPKSLLVVGGGVIGLELATVYNNIGTKVTVFEYDSEILPGFDIDIRTRARQIFTKQGISFFVDTSVKQVTAEKSSVQVSVGEDSFYEADICLVAVGRKANSAGLGLEKLGVHTDSSGCVEIDSSFQTNIASIYAIGDVAPGPMLAHKASQEAIAAVDHIVGKAGRVIYPLIQSVVYTHPEIAAVGYSEAWLIDHSMQYEIVQFPFIANSRAKAQHATDGLVKILYLKDSKVVVGCSIVGESAGELIQIVSIAIEKRMTITELSNHSMAHPTFAESIKEAAHGVEGRYIHI